MFLKGVMVDGACKFSSVSLARVVMGYRCGLVAWLVVVAVDPDLHILD